MTDPSLGEFLRAELRRLAEDVCGQETGVRGEHRDVHAMRVACRRLRALLQSAEGVITDPRAAGLRDELRWLGSELGRARDAEVFRSRVDDLLGAGAAPDGITRVLDLDAQAGRAAALLALDSARWAALRARLGEVGQLTLDAELASLPVEAGMGHLVDRQSKRLRKARRRARHTEAQSLDRALHAVRKRAKAVRYAAEVAAPVLGHRAERLAERAEYIQDVLGQHQDAVVARDRLRRLAVEADVDPEAAFALGTVAAEEERRGEAAREAYRRVTTKLPKHVRD
ncbi:CHAD domain-containing protein [Intrasporangium sp.]|uniref:CHAD domain-containing protein n=1 Tax=Intrasporangium sp. TaxID=1925024 RepID=UPI00293A2E56|nr:CHAD domain-containing protein [Intrasporangium sp.]MDV3220995.1 CHAD domain-containing protein [Intrasporangium sp.]